MYFRPWALFLAACLLSGGASRVEAYSIRYALTSESHLSRYCESCENPFGEEEPLSGEFHLTALNVPTEEGLEALTAVDWRNDTIVITGTGFLQRLGGSQLAMVIDARVNGEPVLLTSGRRQLSPSAEIRIHLASPRDSGEGYLITVVARPVAADGPDGDGDGVPDGIDRCPNLATSDQNDADRDGVGDACDECEDTAFGDPVLPNGCSPDQLCPCDGPSSTEEWSGQRQYVQCIARSLKALSAKKRVSRSRVRQLLQDAVRSGCGRRVLAMR
jgi:hypothetical protein